MPRVLLVEDHADSRELFDEFLTMAGHVVKTAADGITALDLLLTERFDVAVIDIGLPKMDGLEVARRTRESLGQQTPYLIALTGFARDEGGFVGVGVPPGDHFDVRLVKPVDPARLVDLLLLRR